MSRIPEILLRVGAAALAGVALGGLKPDVAMADANQPVRFKDSSGRVLSDAPFNTLGRGVLFYGPNGLEACGTSFEGPTILGVVANEQPLNLKVWGKPDVYNDPVDVGGSSYPSRAANIVTAMNAKAVELVLTNNQPVRRAAVILIRDVTQQTVCDLITDSGAVTVTAPKAAVAAAPVAAAAASGCVNMEIPLGTASGNGATLNETTVTQSVILHGDAIINGEFRADNNGATGLIERVNASPSNPARIQVANPAWGLDVVAFCSPADNEANIQQGVANLQRQGMRADVLSWPGPKQQ